MRKLPGVALLLLAGLWAVAPVQAEDKPKESAAAQSETQGEATTRGEAKGGVSVGGLLNLETESSLSAQSRADAKAAEQKGEQAGTLTAEAAAKGEGQAEAGMMEAKQAGAKTGKAAKSTARKAGGMVKDAAEVKGSAEVEASAEAKQ